MDDPAKDPSADPPTPKVAAYISNQVVEISLMAALIERAEETSGSATDECLTETEEYLSADEICKEEEIKEKKRDGWNGSAGCGDVGVMEKGSAIEKTSTTENTFASAKNYEITDERTIDNNSESACTEENFGLGFNIKENPGSSCGVKENLESSFDLKGNLGSSSNVQENLGFGSGLKDNPGSAVIDSQLYLDVMNDAQNDLNTMVRTKLLRRSRQAPDLHSDMKSTTADNISADENSVEIEGETENSHSAENASASEVPHSTENAHSSGKAIAAENSNGIDKQIAHPKRGVIEVEAVTMMNREELDSEIVHVEGKKECHSSEAFLQPTTAALVTESVSMKADDKEIDALVKADHKEVLASVTPVVMNVCDLPTADLQQVKPVIISACVDSVPTNVRNGYLALIDPMSTVSVKTPTLMLRTDPSSAELIQPIANDNIELFDPKEIDDPASAVDHVTLRDSGRKASAEISVKNIDLHDTAIAFNNKTVEKSVPNDQVTPVNISAGTILCTASDQLKSASLADKTSSASAVDVIKLSGTMTDSNVSSCDPGKIVLDTNANEMTPTASLDPTSAANGTKPDNDLVEETDGVAAAIIAELPDSVLATSNGSGIARKAVIGDEAATENATESIQVKPEDLIDRSDAESATSVAKSPVAAIETTSSVEFGKTPEDNDVTLVKTTISLKPASDGCKSKADLVLDDDLPAGDFRERPGASVVTRNPRSSCARAVACTERRKMLLSNLSNGWSDVQFGHVVRKYGAVLEHYTLNRNKAVYIFSNAEEAATAIREMNNLNIDGKIIKAAYDPYQERGTSIPRTTDRMDRNVPRGRTIHVDNSETSIKTTTNSSELQTTQVKGAESMQAKPLLDEKNMEVAGTESVGKASNVETICQMAATEEGRAAKESAGADGLGRATESEAASAEGEIETQSQRRAEGAEDRDENRGQTMESETPALPDSSTQQERESTIKMVISRIHIGGLIGRHGENIKRITQESKASSIRAIARDILSTDQVVEVQGLFSRCSDALRLILQRELEMSDRINFPCGCHSAGMFLSCGDLVELRTLIPDCYCGMLIGKEGVEMKSIRDETNTKISVSKMLHLMEVYPERMMTIRGEIEGVVVAESRVRLRLEEMCANQREHGRYGRKRFNPDMRGHSLVFRIAIKRFQAGRIVGRKAATLYSIMSDSRAHASIDNTTLEFPGYENEQYLNEDRCWVRIIGDLEAIFRASFQVFDILSRSVRDKCAHTYITQTYVEVPRAMAGRIVGRSGQQVREIQMRTGADISIKKYANNAVPDTVPVFIHGALVPVQKALRHIHEIIAYGHKKDGTAPQNYRITDLEAFPTADHHQHDVFYPDHYQPMQFFHPHDTHQAEIFQPIHIQPAEVPHQDNLLQSEALNPVEAVVLDVAKAVQQMAERNPEEAEGMETKSASEGTAMIPHSEGLPFGDTHQAAAGYDQLREFYGPVNYHESYHHPAGFRYQRSRFARGGYREIYNPANRGGYDPEAGYSGYQGNRFPHRSWGNGGRNPRGGREPRGQPRGRQQNQDEPQIDDRAHAHRDRGGQAGYQGGNGSQRGGGQAGYQGGSGAQRGGGQAGYQGGSVARSEADAVRRGGRSVSLERGRSRVGRRSGARGGGRGGQRESLSADRHEGSAERRGSAGAVEQQIPAQQQRSIPAEQHNPPTAVDRSNPIPAEKHGPTPAEKSNPELTERRNPTLADNSNPTSSEEDSSDLWEKRNPTPAEQQKGTRMNPNAPAYNQRNAAATAVIRSAAENSSKTGHGMTIVPPTETMIEKKPEITDEKSTEQMDAEKELNTKIIEAKAAAELGKVSLDIPVGVEGGSAEKVSMETAKVADSNHGEASVPVLAVTTSD